MKNEGNLFPKKNISPSDKTDMSVSVLSRRPIIKKNISALNHRRQTGVKLRFNLKLIYLNLLIFETKPLPSLLLNHVFYSQWQWF